MHTSIKNVHIALSEDVFWYHSDELLAKNVGKHTVFFWISVKKKNKKRCFLYILTAIMDLNHLGILDFFGNVKEI